MRAVAVDPLFDVLTIEYDDAAASVDGITDALAEAGYIVDVLPLQ